MNPNANFKKISSPLKPREYFQPIPQTNSFPNSNVSLFISQYKAIYDLRNYISIELKQQPSPLQTDFYVFFYNK